MTLVDNPACDCCPHTQLPDLERDELTREVWDGCPESGCLATFCKACHFGKSYVPCSGCGLRNYDTPDPTWNCPNYPQCSEWAWVP